MSETNKSLVRRLIEESVNNGNFNSLDEIVSADYVYREPTAGEKRGRAGFQEIITAYRNAFPDIKLTIEEQIAEGDKVMTRTSGSGTHRGELFGTPPTGKLVTGVSGICVTRIANGKVVEDNWVYDALGMMRQLGAVPSITAKAA
ncbi:MAG: ester cyclase [Acidobacteria bacterium]|nr:ester cyclase [Acidobacteriota bacterium]